MNFPIPAGWRLLGPNEVMQEGDRYGHSWTEEFNRTVIVYGLAGNTVKSQAKDFFCLRNEPQPQEKEWLNPWD